MAMVALAVMVITAPGSGSGGGSDDNHDDDDGNKEEVGKNDKVDHIAIPLSRGDLEQQRLDNMFYNCLLYTSPSPRDQRGSRMPSSA